jgi:hypothetical protein
MGLHQMRALRYDSGHCTSLCKSALQERIVSFSTSHPIGDICGRYRLVVAYNLGITIRQEYYRREG